MYVYLIDYENNQPSFDDYFRFSLDPASIIITFYGQHQIIPPKIIDYILQENTKNEFIQLNGVVKNGLDIVIGFKVGEILAKELLNNNLRNC